MPTSIDTGYIENERTPRSISPADCEYGSMHQSAMLPDIIFTPAHLKYLNQRLSTLEPEDILRWCLISLPGLFQITAFGLTGISLKFK
jgi:phosphoadenosine phosphosulfate reductase